MLIGSGIFDISFDYGLNRIKSAPTVILPGKAVAAILPIAADRSGGMTWVMTSCFTCARAATSPTWPAVV